MNEDERRATLVATGVLLLASLLRFGWEVRTAPPLLPADTTAYASLVEGTREALAAEERRRTPLAPGERIDPNRAEEVELSRLPGVGPALAERILRSRVEDGPFRSPEELQRVTGIGPATLERLRPLLNLDAPPVGLGARGAERPAPGRSGPSGGPRIPVNRASREELQELPGVGPALADRIVASRAEEGPFRVPKDLLRVPGIGPATLERLVPLLELP